MNNTSNNAFRRAALNPPSTINTGQQQIKKYKIQKKCESNDVCESSDADELYIKTPSQSGGGKRKSRKTKRTTLKRKARKSRRTRHRR